MTIALGISNREGVVLATDSLRSTFAYGWPTHQLTGEKFRWLNARLPYLASGMFNELKLWWATEDEELRDVAREVFAELVLAAVTPLDGGRGGAHLMAAGGPHGAQPALTLLRSGREPCLAAEGASAVLVGGAMEAYGEACGLHGSPAPERVAEAIELAVQHCRAFITETYAACGYTRLEDFPGMRGEPGGIYPGVALPLHLVVITTSKITRMEVTQ